MLYSRVTLINDQQNHMNALLQDTYEIHEEDETCSTGGGTDDVGAENYYDAEAETLGGVGGGGGGGRHCCLGLDGEDVRINVDPTDRLIEAIENLREVIIDNTNAQQRQRRRPQRSNMAMNKGSGIPIGLKDERLKVRKEKVGDRFILAM